MSHQSDTKSTSTPTVEPVQQSFARMLVWLVSLGLALLFVTSVIYAAEIVPSGVTLQEVPQLWNLSASEYTEQSGGETGWDWVKRISEGRTLVFASLVLFPAGTMLLIGIAGILYLRHRVPAYALIAFLEVTVLIVAATGLFAAGH
jgi:hypothetical protein